MLRLGSESVVVFANYCFASVVKASGASACMLTNPLSLLSKPSSPRFGDIKKALVVRAFFCLAVRTRLELATPCVTGMYSNQTELPDQSVFSDLLSLSKAGAKVQTFCKLTKLFLIEK